jgi:hypothetical protein
MSGGRFGGLIGNRKTQRQPLRRDCLPARFVGDESPHRCATPAIAPTFFPGAGFPKSENKRRRARARPRLEARVVMSTFYVNTTLDTVAADLLTGKDATGHISLRSAIMAADARGGATAPRPPVTTFSVRLILEKDGFCVRCGIVTAIHLAAIRSHQRAGPAGLLNCDPGNGRCPGKRRGITRDVSDRSRSPGTRDRRGNGQ